MKQNFLLSLGLSIGALLLVGCSDGENAGPLGSRPSTAVGITAPPSVTLEEMAEERIISTFKGLMHKRDEYYANASSYTADEVLINPPSMTWALIGQAEGELSNAMAAWRLGEMETVGQTIITSHDVTSINLGVGDTNLSTATSVACLDLRGLKFKTYDGEDATPPYEPDKDQRWEMEWLYKPSSAPESGIEKAGWHVREIEISRNRGC